MSFEDRLQRAIQRGKRRSESKQRAEREQAMSEEELKRLHSRYRLQLSEHIEKCVKRLAQHFPGFDIETLYGEKGWGAACSRDDVRMSRGKRTNDYSRFEMTIRPITSFAVIDLAAKGTVRNKELLNRNYFERVTDVDPEKFIELIDVWILEYAELFAASE